MKDVRLGGDCFAPSILFHRMALWLATTLNKEVGLAKLLYI